jgi:3-deoxy-D-manno-octulosonic-acid transferase
MVAGLVDSRITIHDSRMTRLAYTLLLYLLLPYVLARLAWRARRQRGYLEHVGERFGRYPQGADGLLIWVHAVSVGETRAAEPLIHALLGKYPGHRILLTHMTPTGRETGEALFGGNVTRCYLPYDYPGAVTRFLRHFRPRAGVLMETEIWPNLIQACRAQAVPLYLVNARLSGKSFAGYLRFPRLVRESLAGLAAIAAQGGDDARRLTELGAGGVQVTGSIKFDVTPPPAQLEQGRAWRRDFGENRPVLLAASTREGEEALLLGALAAINVPGLLAVIVPRHPQRFDEVERLIAARGVSCQRRSTNAPIAPGTRVVLGDSMGEMFAYHAACDVAFIGGSLLPFGGQNLIEACAVGKPVLIGPSTYNFEEAVELAVQAGAAIQVADPAALAREAERVLRDPVAARRMGQAGLAFCAAHRGATARVLELIEFQHP